ncbi:MAG: surface glycoprotein, partial [Halobellus sp.]|uniref:surface glycoprotein n=1 Tax=Halobellus sp. TaxID=1979212 RepID=UPI0035D3FC0A
MSGHTSDKVRAVVLSALMVLSVFGGTVAFAGTAAAQTADSGSITPSTVDEQTTNEHNVSVDVTLNTSDGTDQDVFVDLPDALNTSSSSITSLSVTGPGSGNVSVGSGSVNSNGNVSFAVSDSTGSGDESVTLAFNITSVQAPSVSSDTTATAQLKIDDGQDGSIESSLGFQQLTIQDVVGPSGSTRSADG